MPDSDVILDSIRSDITIWETAEQDSREEWEAAERITGSIAALDKYLTEGGTLPVAWRDGRDHT